MAIECIVNLHKIKNNDFNENDYFLKSLNNFTFSFFDLNSIGTKATQKTPYLFNASEIEPGTNRKNTST